MRNARPTGLVPIQPFPLSPTTSPTRPGEWPFNAPFPNPGPIVTDLHEDGVLIDWTVTHDELFPFGLPDECFQEAA